MSKSKNDAPTISIGKIFFTPITIETYSLTRKYKRKKQLEYVEVKKSSN